MSKTKQLIMKDDDIEIMLEEYKTLREEILQCLKTQYNICVAEATTIFAAAIGIAALVNYNIGKEIYTVFLGIPLIFVIFTSLWITEQSRMMRAGNYIQMLEHEINNKRGNVCLFWENSLRLTTKPRFSQEHYRSQMIGVIGSYLLVSIFSTWVIWEYKIINEFISNLAVIIYIVFVVYIVILINKIINHRPSNREEFLKEKREYINTLKEYKDCKIEDKG